MSVMAKRSGSADLPLHSGRVPPWLASRMATLGAVITQAIVHHYGRDEFLRRLSHPFWFQSFGAVMGMDWHSSGITTSVIGALKRGLTPLSDELGIHVCGGRGKHSRKTPEELTQLGMRVGFDGKALTRASRLVAKVDSAAVQDGYQLYHHAFFFTPQGGWCVVQQGMSDATRSARRYHWLSENVASFVNEPHAAVCCDANAPVLNLVAAESDPVRAASAELASRAPEETLSALDRVPELVMPDHHDVRGADIDRRYLHKVLLRTYERAPEDFETLLGVPGVGAKTLRALALAAELIYGTRASTRDPARFSFAHGGKDGFPYPVDRETYDRTVEVLGAAVRRARVGETEKVQALKRLAAFADQPSRASSSSSAASDRRSISA
jgi:uncharacterized protein